MFTIKNGLKKRDALRPLLLNFASEYAIRIQVNQDDVKINGAHQLSVYTDYVNILGGSVHTVKGKAVALVVTVVVASKDSGLEVNADKTKYMVMSAEQLAGQHHSMMTGDRSFERAEQFRCLETTLKNPNYMQEEIKSSLKSGNSCCRSVQNLLSSSLLSKTAKIKIYSSIILLVCLYGCETWSLTLREERRLRVF
jgi:hypothetical protein